MLGQDLLAAADFRRDIFELHSQQSRVFGEMKDAIVSLGKYDHLVAGLLQELAPPALLINGLSSCFLVRTRAGTPSPIRRVHSRYW